MLVEKRGGLLQAMRFNAPGRQLDRERHTVKFSADVGYNGRFLIADVQVGATCCRSLHEQLRRRKPLNSGRREPWGVRRARKRIQPVNVLTVDPESLAARGQDVDL